VQLLPWYGVEGKGKPVNDRRADRNFREQLLELVPTERRSCRSCAEEWAVLDEDLNPTITQCILEEGHTDLHTDGCLGWNDETACWVLPLRKEAA
jgi:hypothetical protein